MRKPRWQRAVLLRPTGERRMIWVAMGAPTLQAGQWESETEVEVVEASAYRTPITAATSNRPYMLVDSDSVELLDEFAMEVRMITIEEFEAGDDGTIEGKTWKKLN